MREQKYEVIYIKKITNKIKQNYYKKLIENKYDFIVLKTPKNMWCLTKECTLVQINNFEEFIKNMQKYTYFTTKITQNEQNLDNLDIFFSLIHKYQKQLSKRYFNFLFGSIAVKSGNGFITTIRGKKDLNDYTYVSNVDFKNKEIEVLNKKATLNAPLLAHLFDNNNVFAIVHLHELYKHFPTYDYHPAGTLEDSIRPNMFSFNIKSHGTYLLLDKDLKIITHKNIDTNQKYPYYKDYEHLYKRFFKRDSKELVDLVDINKDDKVIDICGGNGRLTNVLLEKTSNVTYLDQEKDMINKNTIQGATIINQPLQEFVKKTKEKYDFGFCQQAINYWLNTIDVKTFANIFKPGGKFIFNTFNKKPNKKNFVKEYTIDNINYTEISYMKNKNTIQHIQICEDSMPHFTQFDYISPNRYKKLLGKYFEIEIINKNNTSIYICTRR